MKDKDTIVNELVMSAADLVENKASELSIAADIFEEKGDTERVKKLREEIEGSTKVVEFLRTRAGCWA